ncbi:MAG: PQQ-dependent sugar dehydrogenase [Pirellulales bacterium]|nr:PQQ-dependent sugar dehydrogenase [Pirellulales bacterium]
MSPLRASMKGVLWIGGAINLATGVGFVVAHRSVFKRFGWDLSGVALPMEIAGLLIALLGISLWIVAWRPKQNRGLLWLAGAAQVVYLAATCYGIGRHELPAWCSVFAPVQTALLLLLYWIDRYLAVENSQVPPSRARSLARIGQWAVVALVLAATTWAMARGVSDLRKFANRPPPLHLTPVSSNLPAIAGPITPFTTVEAFPNLRFMDLTFVAPLPGSSGQFLAIERQGRIQRFENSSSTGKKTLFLDITHLVGDVHAMGDDGLSGIAFHPEFAQGESPHRGQFFLHYTMHCDGKRGIRLSRFTVPAGSDVADPKSEVVMIEQPDENPSHNGGTVMFGPDGFLYFTVGDDDARHPNKHAQHIDRDLFSGVLRIDPDCRGGEVSHAPPRQPNTGHTQGYFIPNDNPWVGAANALEEFYAIGLRNPWRASFDRESGKLWVSDVGEHRREEVSLVENGSNCGWSYLEGTVRSNSHCPQALDRPEPYLGQETMPLYEYDRDAMNRCIIGGYVYRGKYFPELVGQYIYADISGRIYAIEVDDHDKFVANRLLAVLDSDGHGISSFAEDADGELLICVIRNLNNEDSEIYRLQRAHLQPSQSLPKWLSQTGIFEDLKTMKLAAGFVPFEVNSPLWSDRALKYRWIGLPAGKKITGDIEGPWTFPIGTIFVKHFELPLDESHGGRSKTEGASLQVDSEQQANLRRLETRLLVRDAKGGYYGAAYRWNADKTDAKLLNFSETEEIHTCDAHGEKQTQSWLYPGRFECMICHNPQTDLVLGFSSKQLNRDVTIEGCRTNQLQRFVDGGMFESQVKAHAIGKLPRLAALDDPHATIEHKVRSYLDSNCSYCHRPGRYAGRWDGRFERPLAKQRIVDETAIFFAFIDPDAKVVKSGDPDDSYLLRRMNSTVPHMRMPPIARSVVHDDAVKVVKQWIASLPPSTEMIADRPTNKTRK